MSKQPRSGGIGLTIAVAMAAATGMTGLPGCDLQTPPGAESPGGNKVAAANQANFQSLVLDSPTPVLVDFYADWCPPCQRMKPVLAELAEESPSVRVVKVNVDHNKSLAAKYRITGLPTFIVFRNGKPAARIIGGTSKSRLQGMLGIH